MGQTVKREIQFCPLQYSSDARLTVERLSKSKSQNFNQKALPKKLKISINFARAIFFGCSSRKLNDFSKVKFRISMKHQHIQPFEHTKFACLGHIKPLVLLLI